MPLTVMQIHYYLVLLIYFRESQAKWFAKRGLSWHISVLSWKEGALRSATFVHVFYIANQDAITSAAILQNTLSRIKNLNAAIQNVYVGLTMLAVTIQFMALELFRALIK